VAFGVEPGTLEPGRTQALVWFEIPGGWDGGGGLVEFGVSMRYDPIDAGDATELSGVVSDRLTEAREGMWFFREPAAAVESAQMDGLLRRWGEQAMVLLSPDAGGGVRVELVGEGTLGGWVGPAEAWDRVSVSARLEVRFGGEAPGPIEAGAIVVDDAERRVALTGDALLSDAEAERVAAWWRASGGAGRAQLRIAARRELFPWFTRVVGDAWDGEVVIDDVPVQVTVPGWSADDDGGAGTGGGGGRDGGAG
jgi:hypothetical protein